MGVPRPGGDQLIIDRSSFLDGFCPGIVIRRRIKICSAFCRRNKMKYRIVIITQINFICLKVFQHLGKFKAVHVGLVVQGTPVADDQDFLSVH